MSGRRVQPDQSEHPGRERSWFLGHPTGLPVIVALKAWELFSYQGMRAFLVFYLIAAFGLSDARAAMLFGSYAALVLATSVLGGALSDRWLGQREPTFAGALMIMGGHATLAAQHLLVATGWLQGEAIFQVFCLGLGLIAVGTGLLKPNVLNLIGGLYRRDDPKREDGFYIYYLGVNVGSFLAPLVCGRLAQDYGWGWGFGAAAIGMAAGLCVLLAGRRHLVRADGQSTGRGPGDRPPRIRIYGGVGVTVLLASFLIQHGLVLGALLAATLAAGCGYLLVVAARDRSGEDRRAVLRLMAVLPVPLCFVMVFEQFSLAINLFVDRLVDKQVLGFHVAAPQLLSLNSFFVLLLLPLLGLGWTRLRAHGAEPAIPVKFTIGFGLMGAGFWLLAGAIMLQPAGAAISMSWVVGAYLLITLGELMIAPLTYTLVGRAVPARLEGVAMGLLLLSFALGNLCAGLLATLAAVPRDASLDMMSGIYGRHFIVVGGVALAAGLCALALRMIVSPAQSDSKETSR
ncbi:MAG: MFS transporter [Phenylobacterium sp.]|uniref:peptide MFS transporter n=1 Tax=Phenylobacterium sp. TaxID=1871053 RepID=UPI001209FD5F|nr:peptide MFS transporter [Phenylobacterium sp.]TAJ68860.1 MAG: MFS transporter [Phenylobacterium sp.]